MTEFYTLAELHAMKLPDVPASLSSLQRLVEQAGWRHLPGMAVKAQGKTKAQWKYSVKLLPQAAQVRLGMIESAATEEEWEAARARRNALWQRFERLSNDHREICKTRLKVLDRVEELAAQRGVSRTAAIAIATLDAGVQKSAYYEWQKMTDGYVLDPTDWGQLLKALSRRNQSGYLNYAVAGGTANGLTAALTSAPIAIPDGFQVNLKIALTNTGPATFNLNGLGARTIVSRGGAPLVAGDLIGIARLIAIGGYWVLDAVNTISIVRRIFTTSTVYVPSAGLLYADVEIVGGGGGGGGAFGSGSPNVSAADGGGGAAYVKKTYTPVQIGASASIVIGAGGVAAAAGQYNGLQGGTSTFTPAGTGNTLVAGGGGGGQYGRTATFPTRGEGLGAGGGGSGGEINQQGCASGWALMFGGTNSYSAISGRGGHSHFGFGGQESQENFAGNAGQGFGSGGGGGAALTVSKAGGAGAGGVCIVTEYIRNY